MSDTTDLKDQIAEYIDAIAEPVTDLRPVTAAPGVSPRRRRIALAIFAGAAVPALAVLAVVLFLGRTPETEERPVGTEIPVTSIVTPTSVAPITVAPTTGAPVTVAPTTLAPEPAAQPSQTPESAAAFGIDQKLAALPLDVRAEISSTVENNEGTWALARPSSELTQIVYGQFGCDQDAEGADGYPVELMCSTEYAEILLIDPSGTVIAAYPTPGASQSWIFMETNSVYAGRIGDGAQPHSTVTWISRTTLESHTIVFPFEDEPQPAWPVTWEIADGDELAAYPDTIFFTEEGEGVPVESWIGDVSVDPQLLRALFANRGHAVCPAAELPRLDPPESLPAPVQATFSELIDYAARCDTTAANDRLSADGGSYVPSHFAFEDGIPVGGFLGLEELRLLLEQDSIAVPAGTGGTNENTSSTVYVWPAAAAEGFLGFMSQEEQEQYVADFGQAALDSLAGEAYPGPQVRIAEDGRWVLFAQLDS